MKEYIEKAAALKALSKSGVTRNMRAHKIVAAIPAAEVVEVRHGRWIKPVPGDGENYCSVCHAEQPWFYGYGYLKSNYCPNCGARMGEIIGGAE